jgi:hypothetical protein
MFSEVMFSGLSPKSFSAAAFIEHMGVFYATTIGFLTSFTTPAPYVSCSGQAACRDFDKENTMGSGTAKLEGSCRASGTDRLCCGLRKPPCALAPSCHFTFLPFACCHAVCWIFRDNFWAKSCKKGKVSYSTPSLSLIQVSRNHSVMTFPLNPLGT